jgi:CRISPR/Cas system Type II protein with McrA/HNH and RuvC-like nuclease domain
VCEVDDEVVEAALAAVVGDDGEEEVIIEKKKVSLEYIYLKAFQYVNEYLIYKHARLYLYTLNYSFIKISRYLHRNLFIIICI